MFKYLSVIDLHTMYL